MVHVVRRVYAVLCGQRGRLRRVDLQVHRVQRPAVLRTGFLQGAQPDVHDEGEPFVIVRVPERAAVFVRALAPRKVRAHAVPPEYLRGDAVGLVAGEQETPYTGEALQIMLSELKNWENNYMSLFTGVSISDTIVYVIYVTPENLNPTTAFYFDANKGFDPTKGTSSEAYTLNFKRLYDYYRELAEINYPLNHYITRSCKPVTVSLMHNNNELHNFGIFNLYQAGSKEIINTSPKKPIDITTIGFFF